MSLLSAGGVVVTRNQVVGSPHAHFACVFLVPDMFILTVPVLKDMVGTMDSPFVDYKFINPGQVSRGRGFGFQARESCSGKAFKKTKPQCFHLIADAMKWKCSSCQVTADMCNTFGAPSDFASFAGRSTMKQYLPKKPVKRGFKVWVIADSSNGYFLDLNVYVGKPSDGQGTEQGLGEKVSITAYDPAFLRMVSEAAVCPNIKINAIDRTSVECEDDLHVSDVHTACAGHIVDTRTSDQVTIITELGGKEMQDRTSTKWKGIR